MWQIVWYYCGVTGLSDMRSCMHALLHVWSCVGHIVLFLKKQVSHCKTVYVTFFACCPCTSALCFEDTADWVCKDETPPCRNSKIRLVTGNRKQVDHLTIFKTHSVLIASCSCKGCPLSLQEVLDQLLGLRTTTHIVLQGSTQTQRLASMYTPGMWRQKTRPVLSTSPVQWPQPLLLFPQTRSLRPRLPLLPHPSPALHTGAASAIACLLPSDQTEDGKLDLLLLLI